MAPSLRQLVLFTFPTLAALFGIIWFRRKKDCRRQTAALKPLENVMQKSVKTPAMDKKDAVRVPLRSPSDSYTVLSSSDIVVVIQTERIVNVEDNPNERTAIDTVIVADDGDRTVIATDAVTAISQVKVLADTTDIDDVRVATPLANNILIDDEEMPVVSLTNSQGLTIVSLTNFEDTTTVVKSENDNEDKVIEIENTTFVCETYDQDSSVVSPTDNGHTTVVSPPNSEDSLVSKTNHSSSEAVVCLDSLKCDGDKAQINPAHTDLIAKGAVAPTDDGDTRVVNSVENDHRPLVNDASGVPNSTIVASTDIREKTICPISNEEAGSSTGLAEVSKDTLEICKEDGDATEDAPLTCVHAEALHSSLAVATTGDQYDEVIENGAKQQDNENSAPCDDSCSQWHTEGAGHTLEHFAEDGSEPSNSTNVVSGEICADGDVAESISLDVANEVECSSANRLTADDAEEVSEELSTVNSVCSQQEARVGSPCAHSMESPTGKCSVSSSNGSDSHSEMSADSGQGSLVEGTGCIGGAESQPALHVETTSDPSPPQEDDCGEPVCHEFDFPTELCGRLIGKQGKNINTMKEQSGAEISVQRKPYTKDYQTVSLQGSRQHVDAALELLKNRFPESQYPLVNFSAIDVTNERPVLSTEMVQMMPEGVLLDVIVSSVVSANHVFVQQPAHPSFPLLHRQNQCMMLCYSQDGVVPQMPRPLEVGVLCAAPMFDGWFRAQIVQAYPETDECDIKFVDFGGYVSMHGSLLRQIRSDFMAVPFQAIECYLANVVPPKGLDEFPLEATAVLEELVHGQPLQAEVVGHEEDGVPYIQLYLIGRDKSELVNRELVDRAVARWFES